MTVLPSAHERKWLIGAATELAGARTWLKDHFPGAGCQPDSRALEEDKGAAGGARIAVRCVFTQAADANRFSGEYLNGDQPAAPLVAPPPPPETESDAAFSDGA